MHPSFSRYELLKRLASGGMGEVYLARQRGIAGFEKLLVIKTLLPHLCNEDGFIAMFKDEARLSAQHAVAVSFLRGKAGVAEFSDAAAIDPQIMALRKRVTVVPDESLDKMAAMIGEVHIPAARRLDDARLEAKFREQAGASAPAWKRFVDSLESHQQCFSHAGVHVAFFQRQTGDDKILIERQANDAAVNYYHIGALQNHVRSDVRGHGDVANNHRPRP